MKAEPRLNHQATTHELSEKELNFIGLSRPFSKVRIEGASLEFLSKAAFFFLQFGERDPKLFRGLMTISTKRRFKS